MMADDECLYSLIMLLINSRHTNYSKSARLLRVPQVTETLRGHYLRKELLLFLDVQLGLVPRDIAIVNNPFFGE